MDRSVKEGLKGIVEYFFYLGVYFLLGFSWRYGSFFDFDYLYLCDGDIFFS